MGNTASPSPVVGWTWGAIYTVSHRIPSRIGPQLPTAVICSWSQLLLALSSFLSHSTLSLILSPKQTTWTQLLASGSALGDLAADSRADFWLRFYFPSMDTKLKKRFPQTLWGFNSIQFVYWRLMTMPSGKDSLRHFFSFSPFCLVTNMGIGY